LAKLYKNNKQSKEWPK